MPARHDLDALRGALAEPVARSDAPAVLAALHPVAHAVAIEDGVRFRELIDEIPEALWHDDIIVTAALGSSYRSAGSPTGAAPLAYLRAAEKLAFTDSTGPALRAAVLTAYAAGLRSVGRLQEAEVKLMTAFDLLEGDDHEPEFIRGIARVGLELGVVDLLVGRLASARQRLEFAHGLAASNLTPSERLECIGVLALAVYAQGDLAAADRLIEEARTLDVAPRVRASGFAAAGYAAEILVTTDRYDLERLPQLAEAMVSSSIHTEWEPLAGVVSAYAHALGGEPITALDLLHQAHQRYLTWDPSGIGLDIGELMRADVLATLDRGDEAFEILAELDPHERHALCPHRFMARLALQHGDLHGADRALADCEQLGEGHSPRTLIDVQLLRSAIEHERGELGLSDVSFDRALHAMARTGVRSPLRHVPAALLGKLSERALTRTQGAEPRRILERVLEYTDGHDDELDPLSERERLVLVYVERKLTVAQIAAELYISPNTVKTHLRRLYRKLDVTTRDEAIRRARALGLHLGTAPEITRESPALGDTPV